MEEISEEASSVVSLEIDKKIMLLDVISNDSNIFDSDTSSTEKNQS